MIFIDVVVEGELDRDEAPSALACYRYHPFIISHLPRLRMITTGDLHRLRDHFRAKAR
jgi:hypothetical protein